MSSTPSTSIVVWLNLIAVFLDMAHNPAVKIRQHIIQAYFLDDLTVGNKNVMVQ